MRNVHILHQKVIASNFGYSARRCSARNSNIFTDTIVITNLTECVFASKLQILWFGRDTCTGKYLIIVTKPGSVMKRYTILEVIAVANYCVSVNIAKRSDNVIIPKHCFGMHECHWTYLVHIFKVSWLFILDNLCSKSCFRYHLVAYKHVTFH